jgi:hypothetical protein
MFTSEPTTELKAGGSRGRLSRVPAWVKAAYLLGWLCTSGWLYLGPMSFSYSRQEILNPGLWKPVALLVYALLLGAVWPVVAVLCVVALCVVWISSHG